MSPKSFAFPIDHKSNVNCDHKSNGNWAVFSRQLPVILLLSQLCFGGRLCGDEIVLRNLKKIADVQVQSFDEDGIVLSSGKRFTLDSVHSARFDEQQEFDKILHRLGQPLFRIRLRLQKRDFENFQPHLDLVYPTFENRKSQTGILVHVAKFQESVLLGKWELAILSHFKLVTLAKLNQENAAFLESIGYQFDKQTGLSGQISPFGFAKESLVKNWEAILTAYQDLPEKRPSGLDFYFFCLANAAEMEVAPEVVSNRLKTSVLENLFLETLQVVNRDNSNANQIQTARAKLMEVKLDENVSNVHKALYYYVHGQLELKSAQGDETEGLLSLLRIHAEYGQTLPAISAAALKQVYEVLELKEPPKNAKSIASELLSGYPSSIYTKQLRIKGTE